MATKKQKRLAMEAKRAEREAILREEGLAAQREDRERREKAAKDAKIKASKELLERHEREKQTRRDISDAKREHQSFMDLTPEQRMNFIVAASLMDVETNQDGSIVAVATQTPSGLVVNTNSK